MKLASAVPVVVAALALAPAAAALIPVQPGDTILVYPTRLACTVDAVGSAGPMLHCFRGTKTGTPIVGSYQVSIGRASISVERIGAKGKTTSVFHRAEPKASHVTLAARITRSPTLFASQFGDTPLTVAGSNVFCVIAGKPNGLVCDPAGDTNLKTTITKSYGFVITTKALTVTQATDPQGHSKAVFTKNF